VTAGNDLRNVHVNGTRTYRPSGSRPLIAVVGGGITGLAAAHRLIELEPSIQVKLLEASHRLGGVLDSVTQDGFLLECGADNFITNTPEAIDLCRRLGFEDQLTRTNPGLRQAFVVNKGKLRKIPPGFVVMAPSRIWPIITTPILSPLGKLRLAWEYFVRAKTDETEESLSEFAKRRFGRQVYERLIQPLVGSIYATNPDQLSLKATLPRFIEMERDHGSLIRGALRQRSSQLSPNSTGSGAPYSLFVAPRNGMSSLVEAIAARLPEGTVQFDSPVEYITRSSCDHWFLSLGRDRRQSFEVDAVIVAIPATRAAEMLSTIDHEMILQLRKIPSSPSAIVSLGYRREQIAHPMDGLGFVVPLVERRRILSGTFSSIKYPGRAPDGCVLIRVFIGGPDLPDVGHLSDHELLTIATEELRPLLAIRGQPNTHHISRHETGMPQYHLGHDDVVKEIESRTAKLPGLELAGNAYHGVGIPNCIRSGEQAAEQVLAHLGIASASAPLSTTR